MPDFQESIYIARRLHRADKYQTGLETFGRLKVIKVFMSMYHSHC